MTDFEGLLERNIWKATGLKGLKGGGIHIFEKHLFWLRSIHDPSKFIRIKDFTKIRELNIHMMDPIRMIKILIVKKPQYLTKDKSYMNVLKNENYD